MADSLRRSGHVRKGKGCRCGEAHRQPVGAAGLFLLIAAFTANAHKAKGIDATLRAFTKTPAGPWLLVLVAIGLVMFGCYSWAESRWRKV